MNHRTLKAVLDMSATPIAATVTIAVRPGVGGSGGGDFVSGNLRLYLVEHEMGRFDLYVVRAGIVASTRSTFYLLSCVVWANYSYIKPERVDSHSSSTRWQLTPTIFSCPESMRACARVRGEKANDRVCVIAFPRPFQCAVHHNFWSCRRSSVSRLRGKATTLGPSTRHDDLTHAFTC